MKEHVISIIIASISLVCGIIFHINGMHAGAMIIDVIAAVFICISIVGIIEYIKKRRREQEENNSQSEDNGSSGGEEKGIGEMEIGKDFTIR